MINDIVQAVKNTNWSKTDDFKVYIFTKSGMNVDKILENINLNTIWEKSIISVQLPTMTGNAQQHWLGGEWRVANQKPELFRFEMRFRDFNNGELRRYFNTLFTYSQFNYAEDAEISISVTDRQDTKVIFSSDKVIIEQVSDVTLDTTNSAITEFSVTFLSPTYSDDFINNLGLAEYGAKFGTNSADVNQVISANQTEGA